MTLDLEHELEAVAARIAALLTEDGLCERAEEELRCARDCLADALVSQRMSDPDSPTPDELRRDYLTDEWMASRK